VGTMWRFRERGDHEDFVRDHGKFCAPTPDPVSIPVSLFNSYSYVCLNPWQGLSTATVVSIHGYGQLT
jgi:hypothetical protein